MTRKISELVLVTFGLLFSFFCCPGAANAEDDYDPHAEYHPDGLPTKQSLPTKQRIPTKQAEKDRKDKYDNLEMNKWPPDLWPRDQNDRDDPPRGDITSRRMKPINSRGNDGSESLELSNNTEGQIAHEKLLSILKISINHLRHSVK